MDTNKDDRLARDESQPCRSVFDANPEAVIFHGYLQKSLNRSGARAVYIVHSSWFRLDLSHLSVKLLEVGAGGQE
jgi:hypothetical protein